MGLPIRTSVAALLLVVLSGCASASTSRDLAPPVPNTSGWSTFSSTTADKSVTAFVDPQMCPEDAAEAANRNTTVVVAVGKPGFTVHISTVTTWGDGPTYVDKSNFTGYMYNVTTDDKGNFAVDVPCSSVSTMVITLATGDPKKPTLLAAIPLGPKPQPSPTTEPGAQQS